MELTGVIDRIVQISDFKKNPSKFLEEVARGTPITITQGRKANAILVPRDTWARILIRLQELEDELETQELLSDPKVQQRLKEGLSESGIPLHEARKRLRVAHKSR